MTKRVQLGLVIVVVAITAVGLLILIRDSQQQKQGAELACSNDQELIDRINQAAIAGIINDRAVALDNLQAFSQQVQTRADYASDPTCLAVIATYAGYSDDLATITTQIEAIEQLEANGVFIADSFAHDLEALKGRKRVVEIKQKPQFNGGQLFPVDDVNE